MILPIAMTSGKRAMKTKIDDFLSSKKLSANSLSAYRYDLGQFCDLVGDKVTQDRLNLYQTSLLHLKPAVQKRKLSAVNQFLYFLYEKRVLTDFYRLNLVLKSPGQSPLPDGLDLSILWEPTDYREGQLLALLMSQLGLTPTEILGIGQADIDLNFEIIRIKRGNQMRILSLPKRLLPYLEVGSGQVYLFDRDGQMYSRQWLNHQVKVYLSSLNHSQLLQLSPKDLREQFILKQVADGRSSWELAKHLGLKTTQTLEKYYTNGY